ncbi:MAG: hypothetical protein AAF915_19140 [Cyanobacteria bacterium P01_D01_bin.50]
MSAKFKIILVLILSIFATVVVTGVYKIKQWHSDRLSTAKKQQQNRAHNISDQKTLASSSRIKYKSIPLTRFNTILKGTDPAALAINALDTTESKKVTRKVEVVYPQPDRAMVTITQTNLASSELTPVKYRVELTSFGRSLFVTSPPLWQIVWAGSYQQCLADRTNSLSSATCP